MAALFIAKKYYAADGPGFPGFSIPASEHSTITSWTREGECDAMKNMLDSYPKGLVACVSDSYDIYNACKEYWGGKLIEQVKSREGQLVVRPDSGELPGIVVEVLEDLDGAQAAAALRSHDPRRRYLHRLPPRHYR